MILPIRILVLQLNTQNWSILHTYLLYVELLLRIELWLNSEDWWFFSLLLTCFLYHALMFPKFYSLFKTLTIICHTYLPPVHYYFLDTFFKQLIKLFK